MESVLSKSSSAAGFTLIELSIVLVIIGLIVGGVLVGQDLIRAAEIRATITQIEKFNTAVNTFRGKFNAIPGDMNYADAVTFGFATLGRTAVAVAGQGDGNGLIDGYVGLQSLVQTGGETGAFWVDISSSAGGNLIEGGFSKALESVVSSFPIPYTDFFKYFAPAKLGRGNWIYVYETNGNNYFGMSNISAVGMGTGIITSSGTLAPIQAYNIDKKTDDGIASTGNVTYNYVNTNAVTASATAAAGAYTSSICADSTTFAYITGTPSYGQGSACGLSFKFQ